MSWARARFAGQTLAQDTRADATLLAGFGRRWKGLRGWVAPHWVD